MITITQKQTRKTATTEHGYINNPTHKEWHKITTVWFLFIPIFQYRELLDTSMKK